MKYAIMQGDKPIYAKEYYIGKDGEIIINFNKNEELMKAYGFKPIVDLVPEYNVATEYVVITGYEESEEEIIVIYEVRQIQKTREQLVQDDRERCLQMFAETLTDEQALQVPLVFNEFEIGVLYKVGTRILYNDVLYKVLIEHTSQETWTPNVSPSLFAKVLNETPDGSIPEWEQPDSTNGYMKGDKVMFEGKTYESLIDNNVWSPLGNPTSWLCLDEEIIEPEPEEPEIPEEPVEPEPEQPVEPKPEPEEPKEPEVEQIPEWVQPHAGNPYKTGDKVMFEGKVYVSLIDGNVWSPTSYPQGWQLV